MNNSHCKRISITVKILVGVENDLTYHGYFSVQNGPLAWTVQSRVSIFIVIRTIFVLQRDCLPFGACVTFVNHLKR